MLLLICFCYFSFVLFFFLHYTAIAIIGFCDFNTFEDYAVQLHVWPFRPLPLKRCACGHSQTYTHHQAHAWASTRAHTKKLDEAEVVTHNPVCSPASPRITCAVRPRTWSHPHLSGSRQQLCSNFLLMAWKQTAHAVCLGLMVWSVRAVLLLVMEHFDCHFSSEVKEVIFFFFKLP